MCVSSRLLLHSEEQVNYEGCSGQLSIAFEKFRAMRGGSRVYAIRFDEFEVKRAYLSSTNRINARSQ
jgi:hypothetical protein